MEWKGDPALPVAVRNLEPKVQARLLRAGGGARAGLAGLLDRVTGRIARLAPESVGETLAWLQKVAEAKRDASIFDPAARRGSFREFKLPRPNGPAAFEVVGIPFTNPGLCLVELASPRLGASLLETRLPMLVPTAVLVTNLAVHLKWGAEQSVVWVTALDAGQPVPGARVTIWDCRGTTLWQGETDRHGIDRVTGLPARGVLPRCGRVDIHEDFQQSEAPGSLCAGLFVTAQTLDDMRFVHSSWQRGIERWRFQLPFESSGERVLAHSIFDRPLFRAGEVVHMKHVVRLRTLRGVGPVPEGERPRKATLRPPAEPQAGASEFPLDLSVQYLAGGGAGRLPVTLRAQIRPKAVAPLEGFEEFTLANGGVGEGIARLDTFAGPGVRSARRPP